MHVAPNGLSIKQDTLKQRNRCLHKSHHGVVDTWRSRVMFLTFPHPIKSGEGSSDHSIYISPVREPLQVRSVVMVCNQSLRHRRALLRGGLTEKVSAEMMHHWVLKRTVAALQLTYAAKPLDGVKEMGKPTYTAFAPPPRTIEHHFSKLLIWRNSCRP